MPLSALLAPETLADPVSSEQLKIVVLYASETARARAERTAEWIAARCTDPTQLERVSIAFDELAGDLAPLAGANVLLIAGAVDQPVPERLKESLANAALQRSHAAPALVALGMVEPNHAPASQALFDSLEPVARRLGLRLYCSMVPTALAAV